MSGSAAEVHEFMLARRAGEIGSACAVDQHAGCQVETRAGVPAGE